MPSRRHRAAGVRLPTNTDYDYADRHNQNQYFAISLEVAAACPADMRCTASSASRNKTTYGLHLPRTLERVESVWLCNADTHGKPRRKNSTIKNPELRLRRVVSFSSDGTFRRMLSYARLPLGDRPARSVGSSSVFISRQTDNSL